MSTPRPDSGRPGRSAPPLDAAGSRSPGSRPPGSGPTGAGPTGAGPTGAGPGGQHYFSASPDGPDIRRELTLTLGGRAVRVITASGVFSSERLDLGTAVLLRAVPDPPATGDLLDLGCGWGPLALTLALRSPGATVWAVDVNERARELTAANAARLGLANVRVVAPEQVPDDVRFAAIWSNPPIRIGKAELHALLERWLARLAPDGLAHLVVQRNLGADSLHEWLGRTEQDGPGTRSGHERPRWRVERIGSAKGYRVLRVSR